MPTMHISRSTTINAPKKRIKKVLMDFKQWPVWSPWLIIEPETILTFNEKQGDIGAAYDWNGTLVGSGMMELTHVDDKDIEMHLQFRKPFKSKANVIFTLEEGTESTEVIWHMQSHLPWFMFFMKKQMEIYIGMDYERGLMMLKEYIEEGKVSCSEKIEGVQTLEQQHYIGIENSADFETLGDVMRKDFEALHTLITKQGLNPDKAPFSIYHTFDMSKRHSSFTSCFPYEGEVDLPEGFIKGEIQAQKALKVTHTGKYPYLGNAWAAAFSYARAKKIKTTKKPMGIEFYINDPAKTAPEKLITEVYLPLK